MRLKSLIVPVGIALLCAFMGQFTVVYVGAVSDSLIRVALLPLVIILMLVLVTDKQHLFLLIMLFRTIGDPIFDAAKFTLGGLSIGVGALVNALMILIALMYVIERPVNQVRHSIPLWAPVLLLVILASAFRSPDHVNALRTVLVLVSYGAVFLVPFYLRKENDGIRFSINIVLLSSLLPALYAFFDIATGWGQGGVDGFRLKSSFSHANIFAFYLLLVVSLLFYQLKDKAQPLSPVNRLLFVSYLFLLLAFLVLTKTRSAWLACFLIFGIYGLRHERRLLVYLVLAPLLALLLPDVRDRLLDLTADNVYDPYAQLNSFDWRVEIWKSGLAWMKPMSLLIGNGLDSFAFTSPQFFALAGDKNFGAHNVYVQWFFETGLVGISFFVWVFYKLLYRLSRRFASDSAGTTIVISLVIAYLLVCASDNMVDYLSFNWYFWFICGTFCSAAMVTGRVPGPVSVTAAVPDIVELTPMQRRQQARAGRPVGGLG